VTSNTGSGGEQRTAIWELDACFKELTSYNGRKYPCSQYRKMHHVGTVDHPFTEAPQQEAKHEPENTETDSPNDSANNLSDSVVGSKQHVAQQPDRLRELVGELLGEFSWQHVDKMSSTGTLGKRLIAALGNREQRCDQYKECDQIDGSLICSNHTEVMFDDNQQVTRWRGGKFLSPESEQA